MPYQRRPYPKSAKQRAASQVIAFCTSKTFQATQSPVESWGQFSPPSPTRLALFLLWLLPSLIVPLESTGLVTGLRPGGSFSPIIRSILKKNDSSLFLDLSILTSYGQSEPSSVYQYLSQPEYEDRGARISRRKSKAGLLHHLPCNKVTQL